MNHFIPLDQAVQMTSLYREQKENILDPQYRGKNILSICETFDAAPFLTVISKPDCQSLRIYFGMSDDLKVHAIIVGVNANNEDILPASSSTSSVNKLSSQLNDDPGDDDIIEIGVSCPPTCPPPSPLNGE